jgi:hypothetical protein
MKGMAKAFTVTGPARAGTLPRADVAISLTDYDFAFSHPLTKGRHAIAVTNNSAQPHMLAIQRLHPGTGVKDFLGWSRDPKGQPAPATGMGGTTEIAPGATVIVAGTFPPGRYAAICFTPDHGDGKPHFQHGMQKEFEVK